MQELILYIASRYAGNSQFGVTRLNKVLFWADFEQFRRTGQAITGGNYIKLDNGPVLERFDGILDGLRARRALYLEEVASGPYTLKRPVALRPANLELFTPEELRLIDEVIEANQGKTTTDVSDLSHEFVGWQVARLGEAIPYGTAFLASPSLTDDEIAYGLRLAEQPSRL
jgi:hypothetical protein